MVTGEVKIHDSVFVNYEIENSGKKMGDDTVYLCRIQGYDGGGYRFDESFAVLHTPDDGLLSLVVGALMKAERIIRGGEDTR